MQTLLIKSVAAVASLLLTAGVVAFAEPASADVAAPRTVVQIADLNLASAAGKATADRRIQAAAAQVCGTDGSAMSPAGQCRADAITRARQALQIQLAQR